MEEIASMSDNGTPFVLSLPESLEIVETYHNLAKYVSKEVDEISDTPQVEVSYDPKAGKIVCKLSETETKLIDPYELRIKCLCAACVDEVDGR